MTDLSEVKRDEAMVAVSDGMGPDIYLLYLFVYVFSFVLYVFNLVIYLLYLVIYVLLVLRFWLNFELSQF